MPAKKQKQTVNKTDPSKPMVFKSIKQVKDAIKIIQAAKKPSAKNVHYPVAFKKALCEFMEKENLVPYRVAELLSLNKSTIFYWMQQYKTGLYEPDAVYAVSTKSQAIVQDLRSQLLDKISNLQAKVDVIDKAKELGLEVVEK